MANEKAVAAWLAKKAKIDALLQRLQEASNDHFDVDPEAINWGHVGDLTRLVGGLQDHVDCIFREGEYAPEVKC